MASIILEIKGHKIEFASRTEFVRELSTSTVSLDDGSLHAFLPTVTLTEDKVLEAEVRIDTKNFP